MGPYDTEFLVLLGLLVNKKGRQSKKRAEGLAFRPVLKSPARKGVRVRVSAPAPRKLLRDVTFRGRVARPFPAHRWSRFPFPHFSPLQALL